MKKQVRKRFLRLGVVAAFLLLAFPAQALADSFSFTGEAFGSRAKVASVVSSGPSALAAIACSAQGGVVSSNTAAGINVSLVGSTGTISDKVSTAQNGASRSTSAESTVQSVSLLGSAPNRLITADAVTAAGSTTWNGSSFSFTNTSSFLNLIVAGRSITGYVGPNTRITLARIGYVVLNEQSQLIAGINARQTINAIHVVVTQTNVLGLAVGTDIIVGHVITGLAGPLVARVGGWAYGTFAAVDVNGSSAVLSGPSFSAAAPCTSGTATNTAASIDLRGIGSTGTISDTATTTLTSSSSTVQTASRVQNVTLLRGFIKATVLDVGALASRDGVNTTFADSGSISGLVVYGRPISVTGSATINVIGVGKLFVHRVVRLANMIEVRGLELLVNQPNVFGLAVGTSVRVAVASGSIL